MKELVNITGRNKTRVFIITEIPIEMYYVELKFNVAFREDSDGFFIHSDIPDINRLYIKYDIHKGGASRYDNINSAYFTDDVGKTSLRVYALSNTAKEITKLKLLM